jgi:hypothetical protein
LISGWPDLARGQLIKAWISVRFPSVEQF